MEEGPRLPLAPTATGAEAVIADHTLAQRSLPAHHRAKGTLSETLIADSLLPLPGRKVVQIEGVALDVVAGGQVIQSLDYAIHMHEAPGW